MKDMTTKVFDTTSTANSIDEIETVMLQATSDDLWEGFIWIAVRIDGRMQQSLITKKTALEIASSLIHLASQIEG